MTRKGPKLPRLPRDVELALIEEYCRTHDVRVACGPVLPTPDVGESLDREVLGGLGHSGTYRRIKHGGSDQ